MSEHTHARTRSRTYACAHKRTRESHALTHASTHPDTRTRTNKNACAALNPSQVPVLPEQTHPPTNPTKNTPHTDARTYARARARARTSTNTNTHKPKHTNTGRRFLRAASATDTYTNAEGASKKTQPLRPTRVLENWAAIGESAVPAVQESRYLPPKNFTQETRTDMPPP